MRGALPRRLTTLRRTARTRTTARANRRRGSMRPGWRIALQLALRQLLSPEIVSSFAAEIRGITGTVPYRLTLAEPGLGRGVVRGPIAITKARTEATMAPHQAASTSASI